MKVDAGRLGIVDLLPITFFSISFPPFLNVCGFPFSKSVMVCVVRFPIAKPASDRCLFFFSINLECCKKKQQREGDSEKEEKQVLGFYFEYGGVCLLSFFFFVFQLSQFFFFFTFCVARLCLIMAAKSSPPSGPALFFSSVSLSLFFFFYYFYCRNTLINQGGKLYCRFVAVIESSFFFFVCVFVLRACRAHL